MQAAPASGMHDGEQKPLVVAVAHWPHVPRPFVTQVKLAHCATNAQDAPPGCVPAGAQAGVMPAAISAHDCCRRVAEHAMTSAIVRIDPGAKR